MIKIAEDKTFLFSQRNLLIRFHLSTLQGRNRKKTAYTEADGGKSEVSEMII